MGPDLHVVANDISAPDDHVIANRDEWLDHVVFEYNAVLSDGLCINVVVRMYEIRKFVVA
jgi:hypothetical protein